MTALEFWVALAAFLGVLFLVLLAVLGGYQLGFNRGYQVGFQTGSDEMTDWMIKKLGEKGCGNGQEA